MVTASFHLAQFPAAAAPLARVPFDRRRLARAPGLRFGRLLGTGRGTTMARSADLRRWAIFAVWDGRDDLERFRRSHPVSRRWDDEATERYDVVLEPAGARGSWDGADPFAPEAASHPDDRADSQQPEPVAVLTRATVRWSRVPAFVRAAPDVDRTLAAADGLLAAVGIGELPVRRQATFSLWRDAGAVNAFAYRGAEHAEVVRRTRDERWYAEEWFARFRPFEASGTWDGTDPLA